MTATAKVTAGKPVYRRLWFWLLVLLLAYTLVGFLVLPWWLQKTIPERAQAHLGWHATLNDVAFNPYTMSLELTGLTATDADEERVFIFDRLYLNLDVLQLLRGVIGFGNIELDQPFVRLDLLEDYGLNLARDWTANNPQSTSENEETGAEVSAEPPKVYFDQIVIREGDILFRDYSQKEDASFRIQPLDLTISKIATYTRSDGDDSHYTFSAQVGDQSLVWQGSLQLLPLHSAGQLQVSRVGYGTIAHFAQAYLPYTLRSGAVTLSTDYELLIRDSLSLVTNNGKLSIEDLQVALLAADESEPVLSVAELMVDQIAFGLQEHQFSLGSVVLDGLDLHVVNQADGDINLLAPLAGNESAVTDGLPDNATQPASGRFAWTVGGFELNNSRVSWRDEQTATPAILVLENLNASASEFSQNLEEPVSYQLQTDLAAGGHIQVQGQLSPQPFTLEAGLSLNKVVLAQFEPYVQQGAQLGIARGTLTLDGNLDLDGQQNQLTGTFSGRSEISDLAVTLQDDNDTLLGWQSLRLEPIEYNLAPARLEIGTVTWNGLQADITRHASGDYNMEQIVPPADAAKADTSGSETTAATATAIQTDEPLVFRIDQINLQDGALNYTDRTLSPVFATRFHDLKGTVTGLSNVKSQQGKVAITGTVGESGHLDVGGNLGTLGGDGESELKLTLSNLSLPVFSPYSGRYLGYGIDSGKLNLGLDYKITGQHLVADNLVTLDRLTLGSAVASDEAINAPIKLGLALLRDQDGMIEIDLPVEGDLDNPEFRVSRVVTRAFVNLLVKAATSPFSTLGSIVELAGFSAEELNSVDFVVGDNRLTTDEAKKLEVLADALKKRGNLVLNIRGAASPDADGLALKRQRLYRQLGIVDASAEQQLQSLEQAYSGDQELPAGAGAREQALVKVLTADMNLPVEAMGNLAVERADWLQRTLINEYGAPENQVFVLGPVLNAKASAPGRVAVEFSLDVR